MSKKEKEKKKQGSAYACGAGGGLDAGGAGAKGNDEEDVPPCGATAASHNSQQYPVPTSLWKAKRGVHRLFFRNSNTIQGMRKQSEEEEVGVGVTSAWWGRSWSPPSPTVDPTSSDHSPHHYYHYQDHPHASLAHDSSRVDPCILHTLFQWKRPVLPVMKSPEETCDICLAANALSHRSTSRSAPAIPHDTHRCLPLVHFPPPPPPPHGSLSDLRMHTVRR